jgi:hypothetical protein
MGGEDLSIQGLRRVWAMLAGMDSGSEAGMTVGSEIPAFAVVRRIGMT